MASASAQLADTRGWTAMHYAAYKGKDNLGHRGGKDARTLAGNTPLHLAAKAGHAEVLCDLITPATLDSQNSQGFTPLQVALVYKQWEAATVLIAAGASLYGSGITHSSSSLASLSEEDTPDLPLQLLKAMLADAGPAGLVAQAVRWKDLQGRTALHTAAMIGNTQRVFRLLQAGADIGAIDSYGATPHGLALRHGHAHLVPMLDPSTSSLEMYGTPLHVAADKGDAAAVAAQLAAGAQPDSYAPEGTSILAVAAQKGHGQVVTVLLAALVTKCGQQQQQQQQGQLGDSPGVAQVYTKLIELVVAALAPLATKLQHAALCSQMLGVVLDVLGPGLAGEVCRGMQQQLLRGHLPHFRKESETFWEHVTLSRRCNDYLAEALLLGWMGAEGQRLAPARLQHLAPGVAAGDSQQQGQEQQPKVERRIPWAAFKPGCPHPQLQGQPQLGHWVEEAVVEAVCERQQEACYWLGQCAEIYMQQQANGSDGSDGSREEGGNAPDVPSSSSKCRRLSITRIGPTPAKQGRSPAPRYRPNEAPKAVGAAAQGPVPPLAQLVHEGLVAAAKTQHSKRTWAVLVKDIGSCEYHARFSTAAEVHVYLLCAWVAARAAPSKAEAQQLVSTVVAARAAPSQGPAGAGATMVAAVTAA